MRKVTGTFTQLDGASFYKIENYDRMDDFFMTVTSSCDVWNFCWSQGGITAGRVDSDHAIFPYYTADKVSDSKAVTGPHTVIAVSDGPATSFWKPFSSLLADGAVPDADDSSLTRSVYRSLNGSTVWFEERNDALGLSFRQGWTSSKQFGIVRLCRIENLSGKPVAVRVLDGCRNIMPAATTSAFQNSNSVLLDAYKQTDLDAEHGLAVFAVSSVVTDKAEPSEGLYANTCWFSVDAPVTICDRAEQYFVRSGADFSAIPDVPVLKGKRPVCYAMHTLSLAAGGHTEWEQVFDTGLDSAAVVSLSLTIAQKADARKALLQDIADCDEALTRYIAGADGIQDTNDTMASVHHRANVMFNIMRGGTVSGDGTIRTDDYLAFIAERNTQKVPAAKEAIEPVSKDGHADYNAVRSAMARTGDAQLERLFLEYLPLTFSRRHGDPSRPWNKFRIQIQDNYEGNWRDIFQNWEALAWSFPAYIPAFTAKFLNAMTIDGFNPYRITRNGIDWETPDPDNPWAQFGYWGDHQVIYLQKFLELQSMIDRKALVASLSKSVYSTANVPYRLKSYDEICRDPRNSIRFDQELSDRLISNAKKTGSDAKLVLGQDGQPQLVTMTAKLLQVVIAKAANLVPGGGIWMNTQRPEWNDANNALAGPGLSVVTTCYLHRMLSFLEDLYAESEEETFLVPLAEADCISELGRLYGALGDCTELSAQERKTFTDACGRAYERERNSLYADGHKNPVPVKREQILTVLGAIRRAVRETVSMNRRDDGLYHTYNILHITDSGMTIEPLQEMLEGQVAVLSSGLLSEEEVLRVTDALQQSRMYEPHQQSYMLYPNKELPLFTQKNCVPEPDARSLADFMRRSGDSVLKADANGTLHFNADFVNARVMHEKLSALPEGQRPTATETETLDVLYEKTFCHSKFTGRSGTFYAYEGLGSIYWHMVSKLLLAVQEHALSAAQNKSPLAGQLAERYYRIRSGLSFNKTPELYGAFPCDPYSHTPYLQGAKQPGMTGQVKEEILTRWGELGLRIQDGVASFAPAILRHEELRTDDTLTFSWCAVPVEYRAGTDRSVTVQFVDGHKETQRGDSLTREQSRHLFSRDGTIAAITVVAAI